MKAAPVEIEALIEQAYDAFNRRDIDGALSVMAAHVEWPNGWEGGYVHGHHGIRGYWTRQWREINPHVEPRGIHLAQDGRVVVEVAQTVRDHVGTLLASATVQHVYTIRDGLIARMDIA